MSEEEIKAMEEENQQMSTALSRICDIVVEAKKNKTMDETLANDILLYADEEQRQDGV